MAYSAELADLLRLSLAARDDRTEIRMFGGLAFMVAGHMCVGVIGDDLMVRLAETENDAALAEPYTRPMDFTGRPMVGWVYVERAGWEQPEVLAGWVGRCVAHALSLPPAAEKRARRRTAR